MSSKVANGTTSSRFELPALDLNFGNITDGTDIPPPPDSPVEKAAPVPAEKPVLARKPVTTETPAPVEKPASIETRLKTDATNSNDADIESAERSAGVAPSTANGNLAGTKRPAEEIPPSPSMSSDRPGSLRRLLSRTLLNNSFVDGQQQQPSVGNGTVANGGSRPASRAGTAVLDERKSKRASGWFKRLRGGGDSNKRSSMFFDPQPTTPTSNAPAKPSGPPPPMIPELTDLEKDHGSLGGDLFKNIK